MCEYFGEFVMMELCGMFEVVCVFQGRLLVVNMSDIVLIKCNKFIIECCVYVVYVDEEVDYSYFFCSFFVVKQFVVQDFVGFGIF